MMRRKIVLWTIPAVLVLMQVVRPDRTNPPVDPDQELHAVAEVTAQASALLRAACYDCHSNETVWPWYSQVAPTSWLLANHVSEGRRHLNFSTWGAYPPSKADHKLEEIVEMVSEGEMPLGQYVRLHPEAKLSGEDRRAITDWANGMRERLGVGGEAVEEED